MRAKIVALLILGTLLVIFVLQNTEVVTIKFLMFDIGMSRALVMIIIAAIGFGLGYTVATLRQRRARAARRNLSAQETKSP